MPKTNVTPKFNTSTLGVESFLKGFSATDKKQLKDSIKKSVKKSIEKPTNKSTENTTKPKLAKSKVVKPKVVKSKPTVVKNTVKNTIKKTSSKSVKQNSTKRNSTKQNNTKQNNTKQNNVLTEKEKVKKDANKFDSESNNVVTYYNRHGEKVGENDLYCASREIRNRGEDAFFVKYGRSGIYNPNNSEPREVSRPNYWKMVRVAKSVFDAYLSFLTTGRDMYYIQAGRRFGEARPGGVRGSY